MQYGIIDTVHFDQWLQHWPSGAPRPTDTALAIAACMPSVEPNGTRSKRCGLKAQGSLASLYLASALSWPDNGTDSGLSDMTYFAAVTAAGAKASTKQNNMTGLVAAGLIMRRKVNGQYFCTLTDAGVVQVKTVNAELGKFARDYTETAYLKAVKAAARAVKQAEREARADGNGQHTVEPEPVEAEVEVVTLDQVEAEQAAAFEAAESLTETSNQPDSR